MNFGSHLEFGGHLELLKDFIPGYSYVVMYVEIYSVDDITQSSRLQAEMYKRNSLFCKCVISNNVNCICNLQMPVLRLNYLLNDASYVFVFINGKQFNPEMLLGQDF